MTHVCEEFDSVRLRCRTFATPLVCEDLDSEERDVLNPRGSTVADERRHSALTMLASRVSSFMYVDREHN